MNTPNDKLLLELARVEPYIQALQQQAPAVLTLDPVRTADVLRVLHDVLGQLVITADNAAARAAAKAAKAKAAKASKKTT